MKTLGEVRIGESCRVRKVHGKGAVFRRLLEMGLIEEAKVKMVRHAPFGDPLEVELHGYHLSLRKKEAALVEVSHE